MIFVYSESFTKQLWGMNSQPEVRERVDLDGDKTCVCPKVRARGRGSKLSGHVLFQDLS